MNDPCPRAGENLHIVRSAIYLVGQHGFAIQNPDFLGEFNFTRPGSTASLNQRVVLGSSALWI